MNIIQLPLEQLKPYNKNPRKNREAIAHVAASLKEFGWRQPIVVDAANIIIVGHTRYEAAKLLKLTEVPVVLATDLTPDQVKAYRIADNKVAEHSTWDVPLLQLELNELQETLGSIEITDFTWSELELLKDPVAMDDDVQKPTKAKKAPLEFKVGETWSWGGNLMVISNAATVEWLLEAAKTYEEFALERPILVPETTNE